VVRTDDDGDFGGRGELGADDMADHRETTDRVEDLGGCRPHAGAFTRSQNDRQQFGHARPVFPSGLLAIFSNRQKPQTHRSRAAAPENRRPLFRARGRDLAAIYGRNVLGNHYAAAMVNSHMGTRFDRVRRG
jgi:hypothetical protein